jgi:hypothetical protein
MSSTTRLDERIQSRPPHSPLTRRLSPHTKATLRQTETAHEEVVTAAVAVEVAITPTTADEAAAILHLLAPRRLHLRRLRRPNRPKWHAPAVALTLAEVPIAGSITQASPQHGGARSVKRTILTRQPRRPSRSRPREAAAATRSRSRLPHCQTR